MAIPVSTTPTTNGTVPPMVGDTPSPEEPSTPEPTVDTRRLQAGDLIVLEWRDSFAQYGQNDVDDIESDCIWWSVGFVVRQSKKFLTVISGVQATKVEEGQIDSPLSVPWTQITRVEVLE